MLEVEKVRADTIQSACERYLKEEAELKRKFHKMRSDLEEEKQKRQEDVERLTEEIVTCKTKRKEESNAAKRRYLQLLNYTDIERRLSHTITAKHI